MSNNVSINTHEYIYIASSCREIIYSALHVHKNLQILHQCLYRRVIVHYDMDDNVLIKRYSTLYNLMRSYVYKGVISTITKIIIKKC